MMGANLQFLTERKLLPKASILVEVKRKVENINIQIRPFQI